MQVDSPARIRTVALAGHNDAGKTTLASALLFTAGVTPRQGRVEDRTATTDFDPEEQERGISIGLATCRLGWRDHVVQLVDCPGYGIFFSETKAGLRVADSLLLCVNAVAGVEVNTEKTWEYAEEIGLPVAIYLAKMDRERADFERALESVQKTFGRQALPVQVPIGVEKGFRGVVDLISGKAHTFEVGGAGKGTVGPVPAEVAAAVEGWRTRLVEAIAESDEGLLEHFFEEGTLTEEELVRGLRAAIVARKLFPVTLGAPGPNVGSSSLLDFFVEQLPAPTDRGFPAHLLDGSEVRLAADPAAPLVALAFKTLNDPFTGRLTLVRLLDGTLSNDAQVVNVRAEESEKAHGILHVQGKQGTATPLGTSRYSVNFDESTSSLPSTPITS